MLLHLCLPFFLAVGGVAAIASAASFYHDLRCSSCCSSKFVDAAVSAAVPDAGAVAAAPAVAAVAAATADAPSAAASVPSYGSVAAFPFPAATACVQGRSSDWCFWGLFVVSAAASCCTSLGCSLFLLMSLLGDQGATKPHTISSNKRCSRSS